MASDKQSINNWIRSKALTLNQGWPDETPGNIDALYDSLSIACVELHIRSLYPLYDLKAGMDQDFNGKTPDFVIDGVPIEYKFNLNTIDSFEASRIREQAISSYGATVVVYFLTVDSMSNISQLSEYDIATLRAMKYKIVRLMAKAPSRDLIRLSVKDDLTEIQFLKAAAISLKAKLKKLPSEVPTVDRNLPLEALDAETIKLMEQFINNNYLPSPMMPSLIPEPEVMPNISVENPWDRDRNRAYCEAHKIPHTHGNTAKCLIEFPAMFQSLEIDPISLSNLSKLSPNWSMLKSLVEFKLENQETLEQITELTKAIAYIKTESRTLDLGEIARKFNIKNGTSDDLVLILRNMRDKLISELPRLSQDYISVSSNGNPILRRNSDLFEKSGINHRAKKDDKGVKIRSSLAWLDYMSKPKDCLMKMSFDPVSLDIPSMSRAYRFNPDLEKLSSKLDEDSDFVIKESTKGILFSTTWRYQKFLFTLAMNASRVETKRFKDEEVSFFRCPNSGIYVITSKAPNEMTSGATWLFGSFKLNKLNDVTTKDLDWIGPLTYNVMNDTVFWYSKSLRFNYQAILASEEHLWGSMYTSCLFRSVNVDISNNLFYWSLFWSFSRQCKWALDILYLFDKAAYQQGNFGRSELKKKFKGFICKDPRAAFVVHRIKNRFQEFAIEAFASTSNTSNMDLRAIVHPVLDVTLTGWQSAQAICYLKQVLAKEDGADKIKQMADFHKAEMEYEQLYLDSPFHPNRSSVFRDRPYKDFIKMLLKSDSEWEPFAFNYNHCYHYTRRLADSTSEKMKSGKGTSFEQEHARPSINTGKNSKVNMPTYTLRVLGFIKDVEGELAKSEKDEEDYSQKQKPPLSAIKSVPLTEALIIERKFIEYLNENEPDIFKELIPDYTRRNFGDSQLSLIVMTIMEACFYDSAYIVTMEHKTQRDYGKRAFFMQELFSRNMNVVWDYVARDTLKSTADRSDLILSPGMFKNLLIQDRMADAETYRGTMSVTKDQTKFGDTYSIEAMRIQLLAWKHSGMITEQLFTLLWYGSECLQGRTVIMPSKVQSKVKAIEKKMQLSPSKVTDTERKIIAELNETKYSKFLTDQARLNRFLDSKIHEGISENHIFSRESGGVLGVFNCTWSALSSGVVLFIEDQWKLLSKRPVSRSNTHSDDGSDHTNQKMPDNDYFEELCCYEIMKKWNEWYLLGREPHFITDRNDLILKSSNSNLQVVWKDKAGYLGKLFLIITIFSHRPFSQRPSLLKCGFGSAAEMLQQVMGSNQQIYVPLIRYTAAIGANLDGLSPGSDTNSAMGRVYDIAVNGGTADLVCIGQKLINTMIGYKYGLDSSYRKTCSPVEYGGLFWILPSQLLKWGFASNEARLYSLARVDPAVKSKLALTLNTEFTWKLFSKKSAQFELTAVESETEPELNVDMMSNAVEYRKDFQINFNRKAKTYKAFRNLLKLTSRDLNEAAIRVSRGKFKVTRDPEDSLDYLKTKFGPLLLSTNPSFSLKLVSHISKYKTRSMQRSYIRVPPDVKLIQRQGYQFRLVPNPFSDFIRSIDGIYDFTKSNETLTIYQVWKTINKLSKLNLRLPVFLQKGINLQENILSEIINENMVTTFDFVLYDRVGHLDDVPSKYVRVKAPRFLASNKSHMLLALHAIAQKSEFPEITNQQLLVFQLNPTLLSSKSFNETMELVKSYLDISGLKTQQEIFQHSKLIIGLMSNTLFSGIAKMPGNRSSTDSYIEDFFSWNEVMKMVSISSSGPKAVIKESKSVMSSSILRAIWIGLIAFYNYPQSEFVKLKLESVVNEIDIDPAKMLRDMLIETKFTKRYASELFLLHLLNSRFYSWPLRMRRKVVKLSDGVFAGVSLSLNGHTPIVVFTHDISESHPKWEIMCGFGRIPIPELNSYIISTSVMLTMSAFSFNKGIRSLSSIADSTEPTDFCVFGSSLVFRSNTQNSKFNYKKISVEVELGEIDDMISGWDIGEFVGYAVKFRSEREIKLITPWDISYEPSQLDVGIADRVINDVSAVEYTPEYEAYLGSALLNLDGYKGFRLTRGNVFEIPSDSISILGQWLTQFPSNPFAASASTISFEDSLSFIESCFVFPTNLILELIEIYPSIYSEITGEDLFKKQLKSKSIWSRFSRSENPDNVTKEAKATATFNLMSKFFSSTVGSLLEEEPDKFNIMRPLLISPWIISTLFYCKNIHPIRRNLNSVYGNNIVSFVFNLFESVYSRKYSDNVSKIIRLFMFANIEELLFPEDKDEETSLARDEFIRCLIEFDYDNIEFLTPYVRGFNLPIASVNIIAEISPRFKDIYRHYKKLSDILLEDKVLVSEEEFKSIKIQATTITQSSSSYIGIDFTVLNKLYFRLLECEITDEIFNLAEFALMEVASPL